MKKLLLLLIIPFLSFGQHQGYGSNLKPFKDGAPYTEKIIELKLNSSEKKQFKQSINAVKNLTKLADKLLKKNK